MGAGQILGIHAEGKINRIFLDEMRGVRAKERSQRGLCTFWCEQWKGDIAIN